MKRHLFGITILALLLMPAVAFGGIKLTKSKFGEKGKFTFGGGISYESFSYKAVEPKSQDLGAGSHLSLQPSIGYFVIPGLEIGGMIDYTSESYEPEGGDESSSSAFGLGPMVAYYYKMSPILHLYGRGYLVYTLSQEDDAQKDTELGGYKYAVGAGAAIPFGGKVGGVLKIGLDYAVQRTTQKPDQGDETAQDLGGIVLATGISLYF